MYTFCTNNNSLTTLENGSQNMGEEKEEEEKRQRKTCIHNLSQNTTTKCHKANHYFQTIALGWFSAACLRMGTIKVLFTCPSKISHYFYNTTVLGTELFSNVTVSKEDWKWNEIKERKKNIAINYAWCI